MKHLGLFEGIGGFSLAARWMGWETVAWCEWNPFCQKVLKHHFPEAERHGDITTTDFKKYANTIDVLTGGFPCQPFSAAGKKLGDKDERFLFPQMFRAISEIRAPWIVAENVNGITTPKFKRMLNEIYSSLETEGYKIFPCIIPASAVGAHHERYRTFFIAHSERFRLEKLSKQQGQFNKIQGKRNSPNPLTSYSAIGRLFRQGVYKDIIRINGLSRRLDGITFSKWRNESIKAAGNSIVPQVVYEIFKAIDILNSSNSM